MLSNNTKSWMSENGFPADEINGRGKYDDTPLILAARHGELDIVKELIAEDADVNARNMDGTNALWAACVADSFAIADLLLANGVELDNQNENGATVLMYSASSDRLNWVEYFLRVGADSALNSLDGFTALELASSIPILKLLKSHTNA